MSVFTQINSMNKLLSTRRQTLKKIGFLSFGASMFPTISKAQVEFIEQENEKLKKLSPKEAAQEEDFWYQVQRAYNVSPHFINLENGYFSLQAQEVMEGQLRNIQMINEQPSWYMRRKQFDDQARIKKQLADFAGVTSEEIVICRNTTEALDTIIHGLDWKTGEEAVMSDQDYGSMLQAFEQQANRMGIVNKIVSLPLHPKSTKEIVDCYEKAVTDKTKVILVTHLINISGQVLPVREIAEMAHGKGVEIISDSAHAFAHLDFKIPDLDCDYLGTSLHKWLGTPLGLGMMYMKKEKIEKVWPLFGDTTYAKDDIRKFEHIGTHPKSSDLTIANAIRFHHSIGSKRKEERLRYLKNYWASKVSELPKAIVNTPLDDDKSCGLGNVGVKGLTPSALADILFDKYKIFTVAINHKTVKGVRVTPHLYTTINDLDIFVEAMKEICS